MPLVREQMIGDAQQAVDGDLQPDLLERLAGRATLNRFEENPPCRRRCSSTPLPVGTSAGSATSGPRRSRRLHYFCASPGCASLCLRKFSPGHLRRKSRHRKRPVSSFPERAPPPGVPFWKPPPSPGLRSPPAVYGNVGRHPVAPNQKEQAKQHVWHHGSLQNLPADFGNQARAFS
jgi:hypothetical protein